MNKLKCNRDRREINTHTQKYCMSFVNSGDGERHIHKILVSFYENKFM